MNAILSPRALRGLLLCTASLGALTATPAFAEEIAAADAEEIVVTAARPIAESEAAALKIQKESTSLVAVIAADSVGRLPDQNIAQAVSRLPGVGVVRDQGQARYINLRGAPLNWTTLSFNGINVVSPEGRDARYDSIPSAIASQLIVHKAVTPDMSGETISGNVDVITRSAFDYDGLKVGGKLGGGVGDLGDKREYEGSLILSDRWNSGIGEFGVLLSGSYYRRGIATDNFETDWEQVPQNTRVGQENSLWARETERKFYRATRRNYSLSGRIDWAPNPQTRLYVESIYTAFADDEHRDNYIFDLDDQQTNAATVAALRTACPATTPTAPPAGTTGYADNCLNTPFAGTVYGIDINANILIRRFVQSIFTNTIGGDIDLADGWKLKVRSNYTRSVDDRSAPAQFNFESPSFGSAANIAQRPTVTYDLTNPLSSRVSLFRTLVGTGTALTRGEAVSSILGFNMPLVRVRSLDAKDKTTAATSRLEVIHDAGLFGGDAELKFGAQFDRRTKDSQEFLIDQTGATAIAAGIPGALTSYATAGNYIGKIEPGYDFQYFNIAYLFDQRDKLVQAAFPQAFVPGNFYNVRETVFSGYAMGTVRYDWGNVVGGVRVERVENEGKAFATVTPATGPARTSLVTAESSSTLFFPSLHVNVDVADDKKVRVGFTSGAARPDYDQLRPNVTVNDANQTISGGNPAAKPERAYGVDSYFEWYVQPQGYVMVGGYYKRVEDVLFTTRRSFGSDALNSSGIDRSGYNFVGLINGGKGYIYGAEAALQQQLEPFTGALGLPDWMGGFGINANVTLNKSSVTKPAVLTAAGAVSRPERKVKLPGTSSTVYNVGAYYEKYGLSVRAQYQWRSAWGDFVADTLVDGGDGFWAA
ncbi:MAG: TonB-dependent receptor, partial [Alphaproteobacteria bacterium]|nr:TonB-dependent receptor [Alphaproteobacteria bacterium]